jgi:D-glycero-D-manno-heptose 1,7-bisphosphate phosphatase
MLTQARDKHGLDLTRSFVIRDRMMDVGTARSVGAKGILVPEPGNLYNIKKEIGKSTTKPDFRADAFMQAVDWILEGFDKRD